MGSRFLKCYLEEDTTFKDMVCVCVCVCVIVRRSMKRTRTSELVPYSIGTIRVGADIVSYQVPQIRDTI